VVSWFAPLVSVSRSVFFFSVSVSLSVSLSLSLYVAFSSCRNSGKLVPVHLLCVITAQDAFENLCPKKNLQSLSLVHLLCTGCFPESWFRV